MAWNQVKSYTTDLLTVDGLAYWCTIEEWRAYRATTTMVKNKITTFPEAVAPFLKNLAIGKDANFEPTITGGKVSGKGHYVHALNAMLFPVTAQQLDDLQALDTCERIVVILAREPLESEGAFVVLGNSVGMEVTPDGYSHNLGKEGGVASVGFATNTENGRYEKYNTVVIHVTDYATTKAAIEANVVAPA